MLDKTFEKFGELFETFENEADEFFKKIESSIERGRSKRSDLFGDMPFYSSTTIETTTAPKYEYKVVELHTINGDVEAGLNALGEEGWQMVQNDGGKATFMREKGVEDE